MGFLSWSYVTPGYDWPSTDPLAAVWSISREVTWMAKRPFSDRSEEPGEKRVSHRNHRMAGSNAAYFT